MTSNAECPPKSTANFPPNFTITPGKQQYQNPGNVANLHRKSQDIRPIYFDGVQIGFRSNLAPNRTLLTNWILSHSLPTGFRIGGQYSYKCKGHILETPTIEADINPSTMSSNLSILYYPWERLKLEGKFQRLNDSNVADNRISLEYLASDATYSLCAINPTRNSGRFVASYLKSVTKNFCAGGDLLLEWQKDNNWTARTALAARYEKDKYAVAATVSLEALDLSYWRKIHPDIQLATSLVFNKRTQKAVGSIGYQWEFKGALVRAMLDSDYSVGFMYHRKLENVPCNFAFSLLFCIPNNRFASGCSFEFDPGLKA